MIERVSHSALKDYLECPLLFLYKQVLKLELPEKPIHLHFGKALHRALELLEKDKVEPLPVFQKEFTSDLIAKEDLGTYLNLTEVGAKLIAYYLANKPKLDIIKTEEKLTFSDVQDPATGLALAFKEITGIIDIETADGYLGDYKTSSHKYTQQEIDESLQPTFYYLLYYLEHKTFPKGFYYIVFLKKRKRDMLQLLTTTRTAKQVTELIILLNVIYSKVERKLFDRNHDESKFCDCYKFENLLRIN